jgi:hypothetical protein
MPTNPRELPSRGFFAKCPYLSCGKGAGEISHLFSELIVLNFKFTYQTTWTRQPISLTADPPPKSLDSVTTSECWYGHWRRAESIPGFEKFEEVKPLPTKKLYDPHRKDLVDTGISINEFKNVREEWSELFQ